MQRTVEDRVEGTDAGLGLVWWKADALFLPELAWHYSGQPRDGWPAG
jgi:hypothetical protein